MVYSTLYIKKGKKTLFILGLISLLSLCIGAILFISQLGKQNGWQKSQEIDRALVVNRNPHGFEVVWSTKTPTKEEQWVEAGTEKNAYLLRAQSENNGMVYNAIITGLKQDTQYYFRIRVGTKTYILPPLVSEIVRTPKEVKEKPVSPAYGKVILPSMKPYSNGILTYEVEGYYPLAVRTKETGEWLLPLTGLIEKKSNSITTITDSNPVSIKLFSYRDGNVQTTVGQTRPLRQAITAGVTVHLAQTTRGKGESVLGVTSQSSPKQDHTPSSITYPKENALIPGNTPLIRGTAPIGRDVTLLIQTPTKQFSYRAKADENGDWLIQYPLVLDPGKYTIVATIKNENGLSTILKRTFSIIKSGEQVLGEATGTPTLIPTAPIIPTSVPTYIPTTAPTNGVYPTVILPTRLIPTATPPVTGGGMSGFLFGALFCIVVGAGLVLAF